MTAQRSTHRRMFTRGRSGPWKSRLRLADVFGTGTVGLRTRRARAAFTALGIAIGIASMVAVMGISSSSKADLLAEIDQLGTNLLQVRSDSNSFGESTTLPAEAPSMIRRIGPIDAATSTTDINGSVLRSDKTPPGTQNGIQILATESNLALTLGAETSTGRHHDDATVTLPTVVLGSIAAERLGITDLEHAPRVWIGERWYDVIGILEPLRLNPEIDRAALVGYGHVRDMLGEKVPPSSIYVRTAPESVDAVRGVLARTASPGAPNEVSVSRPSDALAARAEVDKNLQTLLLGLGGVALLVGGVGIANVMVISVLERRAEIGVRRALGATRRHIRNQFVVESTLLSFIGGVLGVAIGFAVTTIYAKRQGWLVALPMQGLFLGVLAALAIGALAGLYPAIRAARLDPAEAVRPAA